MRRQRQQRGFTLIELMVGSVVTFVTVLAVSAAFLGYTQSFYTQAGIRGGQASLRQTHQMVVRNLRMAGYGIDPPNIFGFPTGWRDDAARNRSDRLVFRMRDPSFGTQAASVAGSTISLPAGTPLPRLLRKGQVIQLVCPGGLAFTYGQLSADAPAGALSLPLEASPTIGFTSVNDFTAPCFGSASGGLPFHVFKVDVYDYSIQFIDEDADPTTPGRPYLFRRHGIDEQDTAAMGEPVAEDIEAMRVTFLRKNRKLDGTEEVIEFTPNPTAMGPDYRTGLKDGLRYTDHPANIQAVRVGLVARTSTRDTGISPGMMNLIPAFAGRPELPGAYGFRRILSEMSVHIRNMRSSELPLPIYSLDKTTASACQGNLPSDDLNCAGG